MKNPLSFLKQIWLLNFLRRIYIASKYYNSKYPRIFSWGIRSREDTNFTYDISESNKLYLAHTIAVVTGRNYRDVLTYIREAEEDRELKDSILAAARTSPSRRQTDPEVRFGRRLGWYAFVRIMKPGVVVETGVDKGLGSALLCSALLRNREEGFDGHYFGTDINPAAGFMLTGKYREAGEILYGDSIDSLKKMTGEIDLFINDSDHSADYEYMEYRAIMPLITDRTVILGDNSSSSDKLALFSNETGRNFLFFKEEPVDHWYPGAGIGISFRK